MSVWNEWCCCNQLVCPNAILQLVILTFTMLIDITGKTSMWVFCKKMFVFNNQRKMFAKHVEGKNYGKKSFIKKYPIAIF